MLLSVRKASKLGLAKQLKEEEWAAKEMHLTDDKHKEMSELSKSPIAMYLQGNYELTAIPPLFFQRMALLQVLDLSHTSIKSLPKSLPKLVALKKLLLRGCDLFMELSPQVGKLKNLEELDLDETQIMDLPREIGKLVRLRHLRVSFCHICGKKKLKSNFVIHPETISNLSQLAELSIDVNPADKRWDDSVETVVKEVCNSKTLRTLSLYLPKFQLLDTTSLIYPSLSRFRFTVGHHKRRIISRVPHEVEAEFRNWDKCLKFVNGENIPIEIKRVLKYSSSFFLDRHATAMNLSEFGIQNMKRLKFCLLAECNKMETLIDGDMHDERNEDDQSESDSGSVENVLDSLEYLSIYYMENLWSIWRGPNRYGCMSKLKVLALHACPQLRNIFSHTLLENFVNLEEIILEDCPQVTSLVTHASVKSMTSAKFLPSLKRLLLLYLPELLSISNGLLIAPKLESIGFYNCPKLKCISKMALSSKSLKMIKGESQWWEDMNWNETEWGNRPDYLMRIFSPINNEKDVMTQLAEDRDLLEATIQSEGQQLDDKKLLEVSTQDHKGEIGQGQGLDYTEETKTGTDVTESTPSDSSKAPEQAWSFFPSKENKRLEDDYFDLASEIADLIVDEDEPKAKRCNYAENEKKSVIGAANKTWREHITTFRTRTNNEEVDDGYWWRKYRKKAANGIRHARFYYKCTTEGCPVKKRVKRDSQDMSILSTAYKGEHNHAKPYAMGLYNLHTRLFNDHRANNVEDGAEAVKSISPRKGYGDVFEASLQDKGAHLDFRRLQDVSTQDHKGEIGQWSDYTDKRKIGTDVTESTPSDSSEQRNLMINELIQGRELASQLRLNLNVHSSSPETILAQKIQGSFEKLLSMLNCNTPLEAKPQPSELAVRTPESQPPPIGSASWSEDYDCDLEEQELKDNSKKRKARSKWTEVIRVMPSAALEGPPDDGFSWRKYGQKQILGAKYPRSYYRCTYGQRQNCWATKQIQRSDDDQTIFEITYCGRHTCTVASHAVPSSGPSENNDKATSSELSLTSGITCFSLTSNPGEVNCSVQENINFQTSEPRLTEVTKSAISTTNSPTDGLDFSFPTTPCFL